MRSRKRVGWQGRPGQARPGDNAKEESKLGQKLQTGELPPDPIRASLERKWCPKIWGKGDGDFPELYLSALCEE